MFKIEGRKILSNDDACKIIYISRLEDTEDYDALLSNSIAHRLAADTAYAITGSNSVAQQMFSLYESRLKEAKGVDSMEGFPEQPVADYFIDIRY